MDKKFPSAFCIPVQKPNHVGRRRASTKPSTRMSSGVPNYAKEYRFCPSCGEEKLTERVPDGDGRSRLVCDACGNVMYFNPKIVSAALAMTEDRSRVLLVKRSIPPVGKWTIPAGFMEIGENSSDGAIRETKEEANANIRITSVIAVYNILAAAQVQIMYLAYLVDEHVEAGSETSEARLFAWDEIPWDSLAFATVRPFLQVSIDVGSASLSRFK
mmetsp:Transcript_2453/g.10543  ORF Transcript_2453/g.10543 Transcript_2453/m.10543 type:complete len:215 (-) Transcript_2453:2021-2665(-)